MSTKINLKHIWWEEKIKLQNNAYSMIPFKYIFKHVKQNKAIYLLAYVCNKYKNTYRKAKHWVQDSCYEWGK